MRNRYLAPLLVLLAAPSLTRADPSLECSTTVSSQVETAACLAEVTEAVETALQIALQIAGDAVQELDDVTGRKAAQPALEAGQAAWEAYRDAHCVHVGAMYGGGSGTGIAIASCRIQLTRDRIETLIGMAG